jgi:hypothetical protein
MKVIVSFAFILLFESCVFKNEKHLLLGTWIPIKNDQRLEMKYSEEIEFANDGYYNATTILDDSLIFNVQGEYTLDDSLKIIRIEFTEVKKGNEQVESIPNSSFTIQILKLTDEELTLESENGILKYTRK